MKLGAPHYYQPHSILCKGCGVEIAGMTGTGRHRRFGQHPTYREMKIKFDDGSFHVTNICSSCLPIFRDDPKKLQALHTADLMYLRSQVPQLSQKVGKRRAVECVAATTRAVGLL